MQLHKSSLFTTLRLWAIALGLFVLVGGVNPPQPAPTAGQEVYTLLMAQGAICGGGSTEDAPCDHQCCLIVSPKAHLPATIGLPIAPPQNDWPVAARAFFPTGFAGQWPLARGPPVFTV